ncbi:hypothetical protein KUTeg_023183 [Tegillarca granosa]|uniref:Uncharacterized protein n=1 Tax=Tegillarca granosa TaxID=220873 RepID=A0ABQ9E0X2_TEGGR|nr:hypothetical protein KUTeg_023183 [Tegillarca granosa]
MFYLAAKGGAKCAHTQFLYECEGKFPCQSGKCIPRSLVCDDNHNNDCGDWSDEYCLMADKYRTEKTTTFNITAKEKDKDHMTWLKTTVYVVIGCTVSAVLFISVIVIAVFRIRMKRDAFRHTDRPVERRQNRPTSGSSHVDGNLTRNLEHDPFISSYGNIIVNVNNGVQYVPGVDFTPIASPPSYSDVERETHARRHSPPPEYSTVDRNPQRPSILPVISNNNNNNNSYHSNRNNTDQSQALYAISNSNQNVNNNESFSDLELNPAVSSVGTQTPPAALQANACNSEAVTLPNTNLVLAQGTCNTSQTRQPNLNIQGGEILIAGENVVSNISNLSRCEESSNTGRGSRLLQVQDGNLFLTNENPGNMSQNSLTLGATAAESENISCSETTCLLAENSSTQNTEHPAQLQVHDGEIVLTNQALACRNATTVSHDHGKETVRRELDVQDGQIIFK